MARACIARPVPRGFGRRGIYVSRRQRPGSRLGQGHANALRMISFPRMKAKSRRWQFAVGDAVNRARRNILTASQGGEQVEEIDAFPIASFQCTKHRACGPVFRVGQIAPR